MIYFIVGCYSAWVCLDILPTGSNMMTSVPPLASTQPTASNVPTAPFALFLSICLQIWRETPAVRRTRTRGWERENHNHTHTHVDAVQPTVCVQTVCGLWFILICLSNLSKSKRTFWNFSETSLTVRLMEPNLLYWTKSKI